MRIGNWELKRRAQRGHQVALFYFVSKDNSESAGKKRPARNISKRTSKRRGELAELAFLWKAASLGFTVAKPYGDSDRYDFIIDSGDHLIRVQVKSASSLSQGTYFLTTQRCCNGVSIPYTSDEIDFLAGNLFPEDSGSSSPSKRSPATRASTFSHPTVPTPAYMPPTAKPGASSPTRDELHERKDSRSRPAVQGDKNRNAPRA